MSDLPDAPWPRSTLSDEPDAVPSGELPGPNDCSGEGRWEPADRLEAVLAALGAAVVAGFLFFVSGCLP